MNITQVDAPGPDRRPSPIRPVDYLVLLIPCLTPVLGLIARNPVGIPHAERLLAAATLLWLIVSGIAMLASHWGAHRATTMLTLFVSIFVFTNGDGFVNLLDYSVGVPLALVMITFTTVMAYRLRETAFINVLLWAVAVALVSGPIIEAIRVLPTYGSAPDSDVGQLTLEIGWDKPDIWLVVLDGHPGLRAMEQDFEPGAADALAMSLRTARFQVPYSAWSTYRSTAFSVSSMLQMAPSIGPMGGNDATIQNLYRVIGGDNRLVDVLKSNGYSTHMVESGWSGSSCTSKIDRCVPSHWLDEPMSLLLGPSILRPLILESFGYAFTAGSTDTMEWVLTNAETLSADGEPSFVFAHVMAPHPPFLLDENCELSYEDDRSGVRFRRPGVDDDKRQQYLQQQMVCVEEFIVDLSGRVGDSSIVVVVSDHGTDRRGQLQRSAATWDRADIVERMNVLVAVKGLSECQLREPVIVQNVMSYALSCLSGVDLPAEEPRFHIGPDLSLSVGSFSEIVGLDSYMDR